MILALLLLVAADLVLSKCPPSLFIIEKELEFGECGRSEAVAARREEGDDDSDDGMEGVDNEDDKDCE